MTDYERKYSINPPGGEPLHDDGPLAIPQATAPCVLHKAHTPVTENNALHHIAPKYLQVRKVGKVVDTTVVSICATGHYNVHLAINAYLSTGKYPRWCVGATRDLAEEGMRRIDAM